MQKMNHLSKLIDEVVENPRDKHTLLFVEKSIKNLYFHCKNEKQKCMNMDALMIASSYNYKAGQAIGWWKNSIICLREIGKENFDRVSSILSGNMRPSEEELASVDISELDPDLLRDK